MPTKTHDAAFAVEPRTSAQRLEALVDHTADLDKAQVLQAAIPQWLATADLNMVQALKATFQQSFDAQDRVKTALEQLMPLDRFCKEQLTTFLKGKWAIDVDVERDTLSITTTIYTSTGTLPAFGAPNTVTTTSRSLLHAAMENFTQAQATPGGPLKDAVILIDAKTPSGTEVTAEKFAALCRELDLGTRYQQHITSALALPARPAQGAPVNDRASAADIRRLKVLDMQVALHMAYLKKEISPAVYTMLLSVIEQDAPAAQTRNARFEGGPVLWQGLTLHDACICGVLVFTKVSIDTDTKAKCVVYMPNEPRRPLYEYASLDEFKVYLTLKLQSTSYRKFFVGQYLHGHDKTDFLKKFDKGRTLGSLTATPADTCLADFFYSGFVSKTQIDAQILAVPTADVDEQQREKTIQMLLDGGLVLLNAAAFFVPVIGNLMLLTAVGDIVCEVYEGVLDWTHGERTLALSHLLNLVENLAQMAAFAAGGKIISTAFKRGVKEQAAFFDGFEAVTRADGKARLWKPDLQSYRQTSILPADVQPDSQGLYHHGGQTSVVMDGGRYRVTRHADGSPWTINHPLQKDAFQPAVEQNVEGGWRHVYEHAHEWRDGAYALGRTGQRLPVLGRDLQAIAEISAITPDDLHYLHESNLTLPQRLNDCIEHFNIDQRISRLIVAMEQGEIANTAFTQEQLHTLPGLPGWPAERFIELRGANDQVVSRFPETAPQDDDVNSVHVSQSQLAAGGLLDTVIEGLYPHEVEDVIGRTTTESKAQLLAKKIATSLNGNRRPLHEWLYKKYDGTASGDVATLSEHAANLPTRICQELLENASANDRIFLRDRKIPGSDLDRALSQAKAGIRQDRALMGLYRAQLATADTDRLALGLMDRVQGWDDGYRLEVRKGAVTGAVLDSVGDANALSRGVIVKTTTGYQVAHVNGDVSSTQTSATLLEAIWDVLPAGQRTRMGFVGNDTLDVATLRSRLVRAASGDPQRSGRVLRGERSEMPKHLSACVQADTPAANPYPRSLIRKVKKLYPLFTEVQVSSFLDQAGSTHLQRVNKIKELGQQLRQLRNVLHTWRDDETQMKALAGQLNDLRLSRRQVAYAIENCWRRVSHPLWPRNQSVTSLTLERNPVGPLPTLTEADVAHVRSLSINDMKAGDELAYFLRPFKGLFSLELQRNQLTRLPEVLSHMPNLQYLRLDGNQINLTEHTLRKLADMGNLRTLGLEGNRLGATIDVSKMINLQTLNLNNTHATELPVGLSRLPYLDFADLRANQIQALPDWLFQMPQRFAKAINLKGNQVSPASLEKLRIYRDSSGIGMGLLDDSTVLLSELRARDLWMPKRVEQSYAERNRVWLALKNEPKSTEFFELLAEVGDTADSRFVHEDMTRRVWDVIEATRSDRALCDQLLAMAVKANCADSAATIFSNLEVAVDIHAVVRQSANAHDRAARLLSLGRRLFRLDKLTAIAREYSLVNPALDPVEVELAYRTGLADRLELVGQPLHMRYASLGGVEPADLDTAYNRVITAELSPELSTFVSGRTFWSDFLREHHSQEFTDLTAPFHTRMEAISANETTFGAQYGTQVDGIADELDKAETGLLKRLTQAAIEADEAKTCFALD
ncbi:NEL-type E3 ubiquitin ligase domain-containing protein [Pseudomonas violetae]|uniref:RING-type E3 ubiquitin transferase n=1 Tax=Pseudomonas violetae TaxID=2915813 RepID=A0ABT0F5L9_9PSED|nr:NEL-type E3 ubiquitin ligase domain-containing protein [Pseudomonas violetae]MCK1792986.1 hypothetical protein [Pseudomonas violetae]